MDRDFLERARPIPHNEKNYNAEGVHAQFDFVLGSGYDGEVKGASPEYGIEVTRDSVRVSDHMRKADMAFRLRDERPLSLRAWECPP